MSTSTHVDIIVVGAGPAGSTCASLLSERGLNVLLLDKANFPRDKICGDCINPRAWQYFDLLGVSEMLRTQHLQSLKSVRVANVAGENFVVALDPPSSTPFFS